MFKKFLNGLLSKGSWTIGAVIALTLSSLVVWAVVSLPHVFTSGSVISASEVNANFQALADEVGKASFSIIAAPSSNTALANTGQTVVPFNNIIKDDSAAAFNGATSTFNVGAAHEGLYLVVVKDRLTNNSGGSGELHLPHYTLDGGTTHIKIGSNYNQYASNGQSYNATHSDYVYLNDGDTFELVYEVSGACPISAQIDSTQTVLYMVRLAAP